MLRPFKFLNGNYVESPFLVFREKQYHSCQLIYFPLIFSVHLSKCAGFNLYCDELIKKMMWIW